jgi:hypothetical protein
MEVNALSYTVNYASRRSEVWRWYWGAWSSPIGLWRVHALLGFALLSRGIVDGSRGKLTIWISCLRFAVMRVNRMAAR